MPGPAARILVVSFRHRRKPREASAELREQLVPECRRPVVAADCSEIELQAVEPQQFVGTGRAIEHVLQLRKGTIPERSRQLLLHGRSVGNAADGELDDLTLNAMPIRACHWRWHSAFPPWRRAPRQLWRRGRLE